MARHGVYRGLYSSLVDDPDFQALTPHARLTLFVVRICSQAGPAAIFRYYPAVLVNQTGLQARALERALTLLEQPQPSGGHPWIEREGVVLWVRNGLRHDPNFTLANTKHRISVERALESLPRLDIVLRFCDYYAFTYPFDTPSIPLRVGFPQEKEKEKEKEQETKEVEPPPTPPTTNPTAPVPISEIAHAIEPATNDPDPTLDQILDRVAKKLTPRADTDRREPRTPGHFLDCECPSCRR